MSYQRITPEDSVLLFNLSQNADNTQLYNYAYRLWELENQIAKGGLFKLPCKVGDTIYGLIDKEIFDCKVSMVYQKADKSWNFRFSYRKYVTRNPWVANPKYEWVTYQNEYTMGDFGKKVFINKAEAEQQLKELKNNP